MNALQRMLFREPNGGRIGLFNLLLSSVSLLVWGYFGIGLNGPPNMLFLGIVFAFSGLAESLPPERQRPAGALRILSILVIVLWFLTLASELL